jgi:hypothetical protein
MTSANFEGTLVEGLASPRQTAQIRIRFSWTKFVSTTLEFFQNITRTYLHLILVLVEILQKNSEFPVYNKLNQKIINNFLFKHKLQNFFLRQHPILFSLVLLKYFRELQSIKLLLCTLIMIVLVFSLLKEWFN